MDDIRLTRPCLERLSTDELVKLADHYAIYIPPDLERIFVIEELLEADFPGDGQRDGERFGGQADIREPVPLPKQYNITYLEYLVRDPLWIFVFWEIKSHDRDLYEKSPDFEGYFLKVRNLERGEHIFTVAVGMNDTAWYLGFPPDSGRCRVELCVLRGDGETTLAFSRPFTLPGLLEPLPSGVPETLARLSGAGDFPVIRNADRLSRPRDRRAFQNSRND
ncbi:MAG: DUF4912 domain-containing protein [Treponema sp.]|jgi:hypothetical protein|nr:DUF4912 domain-containing protein [Treponema sp.]